MTETRRKPGPPPADPATVRSTAVKTLLTSVEADAVYSAADACGETASTFIRRVLLAEIAA